MIFKHIKLREKMFKTFNSMRFDIKHPLQINRIWQEKKREREKEINAVLAFSTQKILIIFGG